MYFVWKVFDKKPSGRPKKNWSGQKEVNGESYEKILVATRDSKTSINQMERELVEWKKANPNAYFYYEKLT